MPHAYFVQLRASKEQPQEYKHHAISVSSSPIHTFVHVRPCDHVQTRHQRSVKLLAEEINISQARQEIEHSTSIQHAPVFARRNTSQHFSCSRVDDYICVGTASNLNCTTTAQPPTQYP
mmetsp:Transcript_13109/g.36208  ORF Transcript_13109/g.36208 Transcript_13109/m.36208 type:complete len:119 (-) Transcript_13109:134-490(-)